MHGSKWLQGSHTIVLYFTMERLEGKSPLYGTFHQYHTQDTADIYNDYTIFISSLIQSSFIMILLVISKPTNQYRLVSAISQS